MIQLFPVRISAIVGRDAYGNTVTTSEIAENPYEAECILARVHDSPCITVTGLHRIGGVLPQIPLPALQERIAYRRAMAA